MLARGVVVVAWLSAVGCADSQTTFLVDIDGPATVRDLTLRLSLPTGEARSWPLPTSGPPTTDLPARVVIQLPEVVATYTFELTATDDIVDFVAIQTATSRLHRQVVVPMQLVQVGGDLAPAFTDLTAHATDLASDGLATADLETVDLAVPTDLAQIPADQTVGPSDLLTAPSDLVPPLYDLLPVPGAPVPRFIGNAHFSNYSGATFEFPANMSSMGFEIATTGIVNGDLVLFIATIDNNNTNVWPDPIAPGFTQLTQAEFGNDGQNYVVAYKIANNEPAVYAGSYGSLEGSSSAVITLIAVSGAHATTPINAYLSTFATGADQSPVVGTSAGVTTTVTNTTLIYASGADWQGAPGSNTFITPNGFTQLAAIGDRGGANWDWSSQHIAWSTKASAGATGSVTGSMESARNGLAWTVLIAIAPP